MINGTELAIDAIERGAKNKISLIDFIEIQIKEFENSDEYKEMIVAENYANNETDIDTKKRIYIDSSGRECEAKHVTNSKIKYPVFVKLINQKTGYLLKRRFTTNSENEEYNKKVAKFFNNKKHKLLKNTMRQSIIKGIAWWYLFVEDNKLKVRMRYATEIIPIWEDREHENLSAVIVKYFIENYKSSNEKELIEKVEYHDLDGIRFFVRDGSKLIPDNQKMQENEKLCLGFDDEGNSLYANFAAGEKLYTWDKIPFVYWKYNSQEKSLLHWLKSLIDGIERLKSAVLDKLGDSVDDINVVKNYGDDIKNFQKNLQTYRTIFLDENGEYTKVSSTIDIDAFKSAIESFRKDIYDIGGGVDTESDQFGNNPSGVALQELYENLDLDCSNIEIEFQSSLEHLMFFFNTFENLANNSNYSEQEVEFVFNKSKISDDSSKITDIKNSEGIISRKTQLLNHPLVTNVEKEIEQLEKEVDNIGDYSSLNKHKGSDVDNEE